MYTKARFQKLAGILKEQVDMVANMNAPIASTEPKLAPINFDVSVTDEERCDESTALEVKNFLAGYVSYLRAIHLWFHAAHHLTKGSGFSGDHTSLYERIYTEVQDEIDGAIEKAVGTTEDEHLACPLMITTNSISIMQEAGCKVNASSLEIAEAGLRLEKSYLDFLEGMFDSLEEMGALSLGLNDQIAASANQHETYVYLLTQRTKVDLDQ